MKKKAHSIIYRLRKSAGLKIDTRNRTIYFEYENAADEKKMNRKAVRRLCSEFGFVRQATLL
jgi:hypothetical protein